MRPLEPRDVGKVLLLARQQNERDGTNYPVPRLFDGHGRRSEQVPVALVAEQAGSVEQAVVFERSVELLCFGTNPRATAVSRHEADRTSYLLRQRGYTGVHCYVPLTPEATVCPCCGQRQRDLAGPLETPLRRAGYGRVDDTLAHFYRSLME